MGIACVARAACSAWHPDKRIRGDVEASAREQGSSFQLFNLGVSDYLQDSVKHIDNLGSHRGSVSAS